MPITITIAANNADELRQLMQDAANTLAGMRTEDIADVQVSTVADQQPTPKQESKAPPQTKSDKSAEDAPSIEEIRAQAQTVKDKAAVKALIEEFGAKNLTGIPEDRRAEFMARLEEL
jgi:hypothetical protein